MQEDKKNRAERVRKNDKEGIKVDVDFQMMVAREKASMETGVPVRNLIQKSKLTFSCSQHIPADQLKICVCVKKRPIFQKELGVGEVDCVSMPNPMVTVHECRYKVDGITKYIDNQDF